MKITTKLTWEYIKKNKRRSMVTIIGIVTVTMLVTTVLTLFSSYQEYMVNTERSKENWEARFSNIPYSVAKEIAEDENIKEASFYQRLGISEENFSKSITVFGGNREVKFDVRAYDENALKNANIHITEGRFPENSNEVLISLSVSKNNMLKQKINTGDKLKVTLNRKIA